jgi:PAS domain S-box-containing protein
LGIGAIGTDTTERKHADEALRKSEARISGIIDIAPEAIISVDNDQRIQLFNQGAEVIFGYTADEALGQPLDMLVPAYARKLHSVHTERFSRSAPSRHASHERLEIFGLRKDGSEFPAEASISKLDLDGELQFTVMLHDISERKQTEKTLLAAMQQAELAHRTRSEFLAAMSHELRTPLNAIIGFSELIASAAFGPIGDPKYREYAEDISGAGKQLLMFINDILDTSMVESGKLDLNETTIDIDQAVSFCLAFVRDRAQGAGLILETEIMSDPLPLRADERKFKQILLNLLSNAVKFSPRGGKIVTRVWCHLDDGYVVQIADSGIGIAFEDIPRVLAPFERVEKTLTRKYEGAGLGLPLSKFYVEMHGGSFDLQSKIGVGTTVTVRFPAERIISEVKIGDRIKPMGNPIAEIKCTMAVRKGSAEL